MDSLPERDSASFPLRTSAGRRRALAAGLLLALAGLGWARPALADAALVQVDVIDRDSGAPLPVYRDHGRPVVAGRPRARYAVRLVNRSGERVLAVVAIDGVNILSGETAGVAQRGYVLDPYQSASLTGWRKSDDEVAVFEFTALADSYAARTGRAQDVGVIGVAVFRERREPLEVSNITPVPAGRAADLARQPAAASKAAPVDGEARAAAPPAAERLGTGHGPRESSSVTTTTFLRATALPEQRVAIRYDSLANLVAAGIAPRSPVASNGPRAFPSDPEPGYVPDPPWR